MPSILAQKCGAGGNTIDTDRERLVRSRAMNEAFRPTGWDRAGLAVLVVVCAWAARLVTVGGLHVTGDRALGVAAVVALSVLAVRRGLHWTPVHSVLAAFTAVQILTSMFAVRTWPSGLKFVTVYVLGFACFALAAEWAREGDGLRRSARLWILVGALLGLAGTAVTIFANARQILVWGAGRTPDVSVRGGTRFAVYAARATFTEWNLYSSFLLVAFALALWAWKPDQNGRIRSGLLPVIGVTLGLVFGLTRAAWIAMAGIALFWLWSRRPTVRQ